MAPSPWQFELLLLAVGLSVTLSLDLGGKLLGALATQGKLERPSGAWRQLGPTQRLFQIRFGVVMVLSLWRFEPSLGVAGLAGLRLLDFGRKLEQWPFKGC